MQKKRTPLLPIMLAGFTLGASATVPPPRKGAEVRLPATYADFYPAMKNLIATPRLNEKPAFRNASAKLDAGSDIFGFLYFFQGTQLSQGLYRINDNPEPTYLWTDQYTADWSMAMNGGWIRDGKLCGTNSMVFMGGLLAYGQLELDISTGEILDFRPLTIGSDDLTNQYLTTAYRDLDDRVYGYGYIYDGSAYGFKSADASNLDTSAAVCEVEFEEICTALCYNLQDDAFYGVTTSGDFVSITPEGKQTVIMSLNIPNLSSTITGLTYSPKDQVYIYNAYFKDNNSAIYSIDKDAKTCTKLYDCRSGEEFVYFVCTAENAESDAPARPAFDTASFTGASLDGTLTFTMPSRTVADQPLSGNLDWRIYIDGEQAQTGTAAAGSKATVNLKDVPNGDHLFAFTAGKAGNYSTPVTIKKWIGSDYPSAPANIVLTHEKVTWDPVTTSEHDGYVDYTSLKYTVTLNGRKMGETDGTECAITLPDQEPYKSYTAKIVATADGKASQPGESNYITHGNPLTIPEGSSIHFRPEEYEFEIFKAIDIDRKTDDNGNIRNWHFSQTMGFPSFASGADGEDLLVFPPIMFDNTDKAYQFQMEAGLISDIDDTGTIEVLFGKEPTLEAMTRTVIPATHLHYMRGIIMTDYFSVPEAGTYYIGVLTRSNKVAFHISDMDIKLTDRDADVPMTVSDLAATAGANGALTATVSFTMPSLTVGGKPIDANTEIKATVTSREYVLDKPYEGNVIGTTVVTGKPGEKISAEVKTQQNLNTIGVSCSLDNRSGVETTTSVFTGLVRPYIVQNLKAEISEDNMSVRLSWTPPVEGEEPGAIGDTFFYSVWYYADGWQFYDGAGWDVDETVVELDEGNPQTILMLGIMAMNSAGQSDHIASQSVVVGPPYDLPMKETLHNGMEAYSPIAIQRPDKTYNDVYWMVTDPSEISALFANQSGWAYVGYIGTAGVKTGKSRLSLPKFSTVNSKDVNISLTYWGGPYEAPFTLLSNVSGSEKPEIIGSFPKGNGWVTNTITLPENLNGRKWVELLLENDFASDNNFALFSGYSISGTAGVESIGADGEGQIFTTPGMLHVAGFGGESLTVSDIAGRVLINIPVLDDMAGYALAPGIYVVKAGSKTTTIIVK